MDGRWVFDRSHIVFLCTVFVAVVVPLAAAPFRTSFSDCQIAQFHDDGMDPDYTYNIDCCPKPPAGPIVDGLPPPTTSVPRVRPAAQCTDEAYAAKLQKGYELMRALPDDDPRSFRNQWRIHCAYCGGAFNNPTSNGIPEGLDIHMSWLFLPWHRLFTYFHERILQSLLDDPTFSLSYWNWDNPFTRGDGKSNTGACLSAGHDFPAAYLRSGVSTFDSNRSRAAQGLLRNKFPDLVYWPFSIPEDQPLSNVSKLEVIESNRNVLYQTMVTGTTTTEAFCGRPIYTYPQPDEATAAGLLYFTAHSSVHFWVGNERPPADTIDMGGLVFSARDPIFYPHHVNVDRLWEVWKTLGPNRLDYSNSDFLDTEFLFFDENKELRRVKIREFLDTKNLGYVYQQANDYSWLRFRPARCSNLKHHELVSHCQSMHPPVRESDGDYHLRAGRPFISMIDRPENLEGEEEFLVISGIKADMTRTTGFDVYVNLPEPGKQRSSRKCAEYRGRFTIMAESMRSSGHKRNFEWKASISRSLEDIQAPPAPCKLLVTIVPLSRPGDVETIPFKSIDVVSQGLVLENVSDGRSPRV